MDVSDWDNFGGQSLIQKLVTLTGLPKSVLENELQGWIRASGHDLNQLTLDQLRLVLLDYLEFLHAEMGKTNLDADGMELTDSDSVCSADVPTFLNYPAKYKRDVLNVAFATELYDLIETSNIDYWQYGHHHFNTPAFFIGKTELVTNQLGYIKYRENGGFKNDAVIEFV